MDFALTNVELTQAPKIQMEGYDELLKQVEGLAENMKNVAVTDDTLKGSKALVAQVKKQYDQLDNQRKAVKKQLLEPYAELDEKMKKLKSILDSGEESVREQIRELENKQKKAKDKQVRIIFNELHKHYKLPSIFTYELFMKPKYLNKGTSLTTVRTKIIDWCTQIETDIEMFRAVVDDLNHVANMVQEYASNGLQASVTITKYKQQRKEFKQLKTELGTTKPPVISIKPQHTEKGIRESFTLAVYTKKDLQELVKFCNKNKIDFSA